VSNPIDDGTRETSCYGANKQSDDEAERLAKHEA
jgi:hypothetical protein